MQYETNTFGEEDRGNGTAPKIAHYLNLPYLITFVLILLP